MPGAGTTHRKAHQGNPAVINFVVCAHMLNTFEYIDLTGRLESHTVSSKGVNHNCIFRGNLSFTSHPLMNEMHVCRLITPAM